MDEIDNFDTLKAVADDMQSRKDELGIKGAFTSAGFDSSSDWRFKTHLANLPLYYEFKDDNVTEQPATIKGTYLPNYKKIFDLYITDSTTDPTQLSARPAMMRTPSSRSARLPSIRTAPGLGPTCRRPA